LTLKNKLATAALLLAGAAVAQQRQSKQTARFDNPRIAPVTERGMTPIYLCDLQGAEVSLPKDELFRSMGIGDSVNWIVTTVPEDRGNFNIKTKEPLTKETILNVTSNHSNHYVFRLILNDGHCDSHVTLEADDELQHKIKTEEPWVSPDQYKAALNAAADAKKQTDAAQAALRDEKNKAEQHINAERAAFPQNLVFDYEYDKKSAEKFGVQSIFHDDRFTYVRLSSQEPPVLSEKKDGKVSVIEVFYEKGLYRTARIIDEAYLVRGGTGNGKHQEKLEFRRIAASMASNRVPPQGDDK
jgi:type IV secretory pathway VirB9-like protein